MSHPLLRTLISEMVESYLNEDEDKPVHAFIDYMPDHDKKPSKSEIHGYLKKHGGDSIKIKSISHDGPGGGASEVEFHGHPKHVMKLLNHHHDDNYPLNRKGHEEYKKDYE
jgi:hypothetical protein